MEAVTLVDGNPAEAEVMAVADTEEEAVADTEVEAAVDSVQVRN